MKRLIFLTVQDLAVNAWPELPLPALARRGWNITVVGVNSKLSVMGQALPYPCERFDLAPRGAGLVAYELQVLRWLQRARFGPYDVIYLHSQALASRAALGLMGPFFGKRLVYHTHDFFDPVTHPFHAHLEGKLTRRASYFFNGEYHRGYFCRTMYNLRCPVLVVPPNLPAAWPIPGPSREIRRLLGARTPEDVLLMLHGGWSPLRATDQLLHALALLPPRFRLVMTSNLDPNLTARLERFGVANRVVCLGQVGYGKLFSYSASADIGIMLHVNNDLGNFFQAPGRLTEYMACGLPVLASHFTGLQLLMLKFRIGLCADPASPSEIASRIIEIESARRKGEFTRDTIRRTFLESFAFDNWESAVCDAFDATIAAKFPDLPTVPDFGRFGAPYLESRSVVDSRGTA